MRKAKCLRGHDTSTPDKRNAAAQCKCCNAARARAKYNANPERKKKTMLKWQKANPDKIRVLSHRRRSLELSQLGNFSPWMLRYYRFRQEGKCWYCGIEMLRGVSNRNPRQETLEHLISLNDGGLHTQSNTALACRKCNTTKNKKTEQEFIASRKNDA